MQKILNNLGLCNKAGFLITGTDFVIDAIRKKKTCYVFIASDASENTKKMLISKCEYYGIKYNIQYTTNELSFAIGKINKVTIAIKESGKSFLKIIKES